jgi:hypothetical protein
LTNTGDGPIEVDPSEYRILDARGHEVARGVFAQAFPRHVSPGGRSYLVDSLRAVFAAPAELVTVEIEVAAHVLSSTATRDTDLVPGPVTWSATAAGALEASGSVANVGAAVHRNVTTAVIFLGAEGALLGVVYDLTDAVTIEPGSSVPFVTDYPGTPPTDPADVDRVDVIAIDVGSA